MGASNVDTFGYVTYLTIRADLPLESSFGAEVEGNIEFLNSFAVGHNVIHSAEMSVNLTDVGPLYYEPSTEFGLIDSIGTSYFSNTDFTLSDFGPVVLGTGNYIFQDTINRFGFRTEQATLRGFQPTQKPALEFDPRSIPGLSLWLDASDSTTISSGNGVEEWRNKAASGIDSATQSTVARRPNIEYYNDKQWIHFTRASNHWLSASPPITAGPFTLITASNLVNSVNAQTFVAIGTSSTDGFALLTNNIAANTYEWQARKSVVTRALGTPSATGLTDVITVVESGGGVGRLLQVNFDSAGNNATVENPSAPTIMYIGTYHSAGLELDGRMGEVFLWNKVLSEAERSQVVGHLRNKWQ